MYDKRNKIIKSIPDFWLTAVSNLLSSAFLSKYIIFICYYVMPLPSLKQSSSLHLIVCGSLQFLSHPALGILLSEEDQKVCFLFLYDLKINLCTYIRCLHLAACLCSISFPFPCIFVDIQIFKLAASRGFKRCQIWLFNNICKLTISPLCALFCSFLSSANL